MKEQKRILTDREKLELLLEYYSSDKATPNLIKLGEYIKQGDMEGVKQMLQEGVDPDFDVGDEGVTPLIIAIQNNRLEIIEYLLKNEHNSANPNIPDNDFVSPMNYAIRQNNVETVKLLIRFESCETREHPQLHEACKQEPVNPEIVQLLLNDRYSPAFKDSQGKTGYDYLRDKSNRLEILELFKESGFEEGKKLDEKKRLELIRRVDKIFTKLSQIEDSKEPFMYSNI